LQIKKGNPPGLSFGKGGLEGISIIFRYDSALN